MAKEKYINDEYDDEKRRNRRARAKKNRIITVIVSVILLLVVFAGVFVGVLAVLNHVDSQNAIKEEQLQLEEEESQETITIEAPDESIAVE